MSEETPGVIKQKPMIRLQDGSLAFPEAVAPMHAFAVVPDPHEVWVFPGRVFSEITVIDPEADWPDAPPFADYPGSDKGPAFVSDYRDGKLVRFPMGHVIPEGMEDGKPKIFELSQVLGKTIYLEVTFGEFFEESYIPHSAVVTLDPNMPAEANKRKYPIAEMKGDGTLVQILKKDLFIQRTYSRGGRTTPPHPWQATSRGDDKIYIAPGCVVGYRPAPEDNNDSLMRFPIVGEHVPFFGGQIEITAAEGTVHAHLVGRPGRTESQQTSFSYQGDLREMWIHRSILYFPEVIELAFIAADTVPEDGGIYIPIAAVTLAEDIAAVDYQILTHNPHIQLDGHSIDLDVESV